MANPQPTDAHLRIAHRIHEEVMVSEFTKRQRKVLDLILRLSWGCGKKEANIPRQKDFEIVGVGKGHIKMELTYLENAKVIQLEGNTYAFNKNYDEWRISRARGFTLEKLTSLVRINLNGNRPNLPKQEETAYQSGKSARYKVSLA